ncbi:hypothetical protein BACCELL_01729 [Bacteroides cellulosilyticus DSM 14838]|uniref:Uncharacterized protein n=1 Tax=Bacteroides cellulosilyticus DSM 14838 TaxID=537012 RepID=E2NBS2_9BACE|nr:hypothetical protein BACCELL_01729 [Bacteroides cellulosilyticus DSM 14838]
MKIGQYFENPEQIIWEIEEKFSSYHLPPLGTPPPGRRRMEILLLTINN